MKIGAIASLTGAAAEMGESWLRGAELAVHDLRLGGFSVQLLVEDDVTQPSRAASAFQKLVQVDQVDALVGGTFDYIAETLFPLALRAHIPLITPTNPIELFSPQARKNPYIFSNGLTIEAESAAVQRFLEQEKIKKVALVYSDIPWGHVHAEMIHSLSSRVGLDLVYEYQFPLEGYPDVVKTAALRIARVNPELVFVTFDAQGIDLLLDELDRLKVHTKVMNTQHVHSAFLLGGRKQRSSDLFGVYPLISDLQFEERFSKLYPGVNSVFAPHGYDAIQFLVRSHGQGLEIKKPGTSFFYNGITGRHVLPSTDGALVHNKAQIMTTRNGIFEEYSFHELLRGTSKMPEGSPEG